MAFLLCFAFVLSMYESISDEVRVIRAHVFCAEGLRLESDSRP